MQSMPSLLDRRRLKDRIVESVSKAVKQIQEYQFNSGQPDVVLTNQDWQFCKLVEHLDHAFLHGLRHITNGYWAVVQDFTHKATTKEVKRMANVTTNLGRGRAWLYLALMDHLLESYLRCFLSNMSFVKKFYAKEALVLDQQRMEILLTLAAGLEFITFQLDVDVPYLDLSSHMRPRLPSQEDSIDRISLCSMESSMSQSSSIAELTGSLIDGCEVFPQEKDEFIHYKKSFPTRNGLTNEDEENDDPQTQRQMMTSSKSMPSISRIDRVNSIPSSASFDRKDLSSELEVIHVRSKVYKSRRLKRMKKKSDSDLDPDTVSLNSLASVSSNCSTAKKTLNGDGKFESVVDDVGSASGTPDKEKGILDSERFCEEEKGTDTCEIKNDGEDNVAMICNKIETLVQDTFYMKDESDNVSSVADNKTNADFDMDTKDIYGMGDETIVDDHTESALTSPSLDLMDGMDEDKEKNLKLDLTNLGQEEDTMLDKIHIIEHFTRDLEFIATPAPMMAAPSTEELSKEHRAIPEKEIKAEDNDSCREGGPSDMEDLTKHDEKVNETQECTQVEMEAPHPSEVKVHINLLLLLKLHVMEDDEEQLLKLYQTTSGHTEGEIRPLFVLVSSNALYLLTPTTEEEKLEMEASIPYKDIDYILLGMNDQVITLIGVNRRNKFWITTGDETLTRCIVGEMDKAIRMSERELPRLSILTDPTQERIVLRKWAAQESKLDVHEVLVHTYVLLHWEELTSSMSGEQSVGASKEGTLLVRMHTSLLGTPKWKPNYFVLKEGMLYQYTDKLDGSVPVACVQLSGEDCAGCRRSMESDRPHCFELILADKSVLQMCAASGEEAQEWLLALCQAVAESSQNQNTGEGCLACCGVVTQNKLLMCHQDVQTNFFRTLGSANITEVTSVFTDPHVDTYLVIAFETQEETVSSSYWTLYFNARGEMKRLLDSLAVAWKQQFKVSLPVSELKDVAMAKRCREGQGRLRLSSL